MNQMSDQEKLRFLLSHWVSHNGEHAAEYKSWADRFEESGQDEAVAELRAAIQGMDSVNRHLLTALNLLGGPVEQDGGGHHHSHHH